MSYIASGAPSVQMLAMHMQQAFGPCPLVQIVDILCHQKQIAAPFGIEPRQREMRGIWFHLLNTFAAHIVKTQHKVWVAGKGFRRGDILNLMLFPQATCTAKRVNTALRADPSPRQDHDVLNVSVHIHSFIDPLRPTANTAQLVSAP
jgi:hypothetical protein